MEKPPLHTAPPDTVLFISHIERQCGVYQYGYNIANALKHSSIYQFVYAECSNVQEVLTLVSNANPSLIIYNYHPLTMPWITRQSLNQLKIPHIGIIHEVTQDVADSANSALFDYHIAPDPTLFLNSPIVFKTGRLIPTYSNTYQTPSTPVIGSFGFGLQGKGFERLILRVQEEYDEAVIKLHIPFAAFCDRIGQKSLSVAQRCRDLLYKPKIRLIMSHEFLDQDQLLNFLAQNSVNAFLYEEQEDRGLSSVIDYALAVQRPLAISKSSMFRHIRSAKPSVCLENTSLIKIIENGVTPLQGFYKEWSLANIVWDYERIVSRVLQIELDRGQRELSYVCKGAFSNSVRTFARRALSNVLSRKSRPEKATSCIRQDSMNTMLNIQMLATEYLPFAVPNVACYNRILDDSAREQYKSVIALFFAITSDIIYRKIPEANVQQAFVFDTVTKIVRGFSNPRLLCVGCFEDSAAYSLEQFGYRIDGIDPVLNYDLNTFLRKPSTVPGSYHVIFSTSVIEHVENDELFLEQIASLLAPGGTAIITCDYNDQYKQGDPIPSEDFRLYTQKDFRERLLPLLTDCELVDDPQWECAAPDFTYAGCRYTFASLVFRKNQT
jgi:hypothetical protein